MIVVDFIVKLPQSQQYDSILTITDHDCTKAIVLIPCKEDITAEGVVNLFISHIFQHYRLPHKVISNQDPWFASKFMCKICHVLGIQQNISTAYHP